MTTTKQVIDRLIQEHPDAPASFIANHPEVVAARQAEAAAKQWAVQQAAIAQAEHEAAVRAAHPEAAAKVAARRAAKQASIPLCGACNQPVTVGRHPGCYTTNRPAEQKRGGDG